MCDPLGVRAIRELAVPPHFRRPRLAGNAASLSLVTGAGRRGIGRSRWPRQPFLPALGRVFAAGRKAAFSASGGSLLAVWPIGWAGQLLA